jgi:hypothetical protein
MVRDSVASNVAFREGGIMQGKKRAGAAVITESAAQAALRRGSVSALEADEEKVMRMRLGATLPLSARLERIAAATDAEIEVLAYEIEAFLHMRDRNARAAQASCAPAAPCSSRMKEKIVRALRRKQ